MRSGELDQNAARLLAILKRHDPLDPPGELASDRLLYGRAEALQEVVEILINRPDDVLSVLRRPTFTTDGMIGGYLDRGFAHESR